MQGCSCSFSPFLELSRCKIQNSSRLGNLTNLLHECQMYRILSQVVLSIGFRFKLHDEPVCQSVLSYELVVVKSRTMGNFIYLLSLGTIIFTAKRHLDICFSRFWSYAFLLQRHHLLTYLWFVVSTRTYNAPEFLTIDIVWVSMSSLNWNMTMWIMRDMAGEW